VRSKEEGGWAIDLGSLGEHLVEGEIAGLECVEFNGVRIDSSGLFRVDERRKRTFLEGEIYGGKDRSRKDVRLS